MKISPFCILGILVGLATAAAGAAVCMKAKKGERFVYHN